MKAFQPRRYTLYIDESGDHRYRNLDDDRRRYLCLCGVAIESGYYRETVFREFNRQRMDHFDSHPDYPVILHRDDILYARGPFTRLQDDAKRDAFNKQVLRLFGLHYRLIGVVLDKRAHQERKAQEAKQPYHYCMKLMMERYCGWLHYSKSVGDVIAESRGRVEDEALKDAYRTLIGSGSEYHPPEFFSERLTSREIKLKPKQADIIGLQISDLLAHPVRFDVVRSHNAPIPDDGPFGECVRQIIATKYNRNEIDRRVHGYGKIFLT